MTSHLRYYGSCCDSLQLGIFTLRASAQDVHYVRRSWFVQSNYPCLFIFPIRPCKNELGKHKLDVGSRLRKWNMFSSFVLNTEISLVGLCGIFKLWFILVWENDINNIAGVIYVSFISYISMFTWGHLKTQMTVMYLPYSGINCV